MEISDTDGYDVRDAVIAWEGEPAFSYDPAPGIGVGVYTPRFWHTSYDTDEGRVFAVSGTNVLGWTEAEATIGGRWFGTVESIDIGGTAKTVLGCRHGVPATSITMTTLHAYAKNGGMTIEDIYSYDATSILAVVEYANMNTQDALGNGCYNLYRQSGDKIMVAADNTNVVKVLKSAASAHCIVGAVIDIGTSDGGRQIANRLITAVETDATDSTILSVTISGDPISVTTAHFWSIHGIGNIEDAEIGSKSGYIGTNGKCNAYYRGQVMHANMFRYVLGAYRQQNTGHIWIANSRAHAEGYDALNTTVHIDTGVVLPQGADGAAESAYIKTLDIAPGLSVPPFCSATGGNSANPVGDYCYTPAISTANTILRVGGSAATGATAGRFYGGWNGAASTEHWYIAGVPFSKSPNRGA